MVALVDKNIMQNYFRLYLLALPSHTQQWTPRRPLYTHNMWLKPKSSAVSCFIEVIHAYMYEGLAEQYIRLSFDVSVLSFRTICDTKLAITNL